MKGPEYDALTGWRHRLCVFYNNTGLSKWWKRHYSRRVRRARRAAAEDRMWEWVNYSSEIDIDT
jgi:hypothetical protein